VKALLHRIVVNYRIVSDCGLEFGACSSSNIIWAVLRMRRT
jgi:hypothetical protein